MENTNYKCIADYRMDRDDVDFGGEIAFKKGVVYSFNEKMETKSELFDLHEMAEESNFNLFFELDSKESVVGISIPVTLRDYFANSAMQGHLASEYGAGIHCDKDNQQSLAEAFYSMADAMLKQREL